VLDNIRDIRVGSVNTRGFQRLIEYAPGGADKWLALEVFVVAGLLADEDHSRGLPALAEDRLRGVLEKGAALAVLSRIAQGGQ
jgi:hypothetical protein